MDEVSSFVHKSDFHVDSWIVPEVLDVKVLYQLLLLLLAEGAVQGTRYQLRINKDGNI